MKDNSKKKVYIIAFFLCLSLIGNGILGSLYADSAGYKQGYYDAEYTIEQLRSEVDDSYDEGYDDGWSDGAKAQKESDQEYINEHYSNGYASSNSYDDYATATVYITDTGSKYHRYGCQYLRQSCHEISISNAEAQGYTPCSRCW